jgi:hypothetical protein
MADITTYVENTSVGRVCEELTTSVVVSSAEVLALNATVKALVAAPGADNMIEFVSAIVHKPAGTAYAAVGADDDLEIRYTDASGAQVNTLLECTGFVDQATAQTRVTRAIATEYTPVVNAGLVLHMKTGEITTGTSALYIKLRYRVWKNVTDNPST